MDLTINQVFSFHIPYSTFKHNPPINQICPSLMLGVFSWFFSMFNIISSSLSPSYANLTHLLQNPYFPKLIFSSLLIPLQHFYILLPPPLILWTWSNGPICFSLDVLNFTCTCTNFTLIPLIHLHLFIHLLSILPSILAMHWCF
jgi:hypothetical protein